MSHEANYFVKLQLSYDHAFVLCCQWINRFSTMIKNVSPFFIFFIGTIVSIFVMSALFLWYIHFLFPLLYWMFIFFHWIFPKCFVLKGAKSLRIFSLLSHFNPKPRGKYQVLHLKGAFGGSGFLVFAVRAAGPVITIKSIMNYELILRAVFSWTFFWHCTALKSCRISLTWFFFQFFFASK